jgi:hypothetical protein
MTGEEREAVLRALAEEVREASREGRLVGGDELAACLRAQALLGGDERDVPDVDGLMAETLAAHEDLAALASISGKTLYHAPGLLSRTYASILDRKGSPVVLMAEEIRRNSADYPRPVSVELFEESPFDLSPGQIESCLKSMAANPEYRDITYTITSTGAVYLFSDRHLDRPLAAFLAERADTGLAQNP